MIMADQIKQWSDELGFTLTGIAPAEPIDTGESLRSYLANGQHGEMGYLARNVEKRIDPRLLVDGAQSIICTATNYYAQPPVVPDEPYQQIARYSRFGDYHDILKARLKTLAGQIREATGGKAFCRCFVDTAPLAEKAHAARAGLGFIGKNGLLVNEKYGSWLLLGHIVTDLKLPADEPVSQHCGSCRKCIEGCPTNALVKPYEMDARRCISYLTVESKIKIHAELKEKIGGRFFGCDSCQDVCPFNQNAIETTDPALEPRARWSYITDNEVGAIGIEEFKARFNGTPLGRINVNQLTEKK